MANAQPTLSRNSAAFSPAPRDPPWKFPIDKPRAFSAGCSPKSTERRNPQCVVHIAETDEQKCSKRFTVAIAPIATVDASTVGLGSVPRRGPYAGAAWIGSGRDHDLCGRDGG